MATRLAAQELPKDLLRIALDPMARGRVLIFPVRIRALRVGIDDPDRLRSALASGGQESSAPE